MRKTLLQLASVAVFLSLAGISLAGPPARRSIPAATFTGAVSRATVEARLDGRAGRLTSQAKNRARADNLSINFSNACGVDNVKGSVMFPEDGVTIDFDGTCCSMYNMYKGIGNCTGSVKLGRGKGRGSPVSSTVEFSGVASYSGTFNADGDLVTARVSVASTRGYLVSVFEDGSTTKKPIRNFKLNMPACRINRSPIMAAENDI